MAGISSVLVALLAASQVSAENTRASVLAAAAAGAADGVSGILADAAQAHEEQASMRSLLTKRCAAVPHTCI